MLLRKGSGKIVNKFSKIKETYKLVTFEKTSYLNLEKQSRAVNQEVTTTVNFIPQTKYVA